MTRPSPSPAASNADLRALRNDWVIYTTATDMRDHLVEGALERILDAVPDLLMEIENLRTTVHEDAAYIRRTELHLSAATDQIEDMAMRLAEVGE